MNDSKADSKATISGAIEQETELRAKQRFHKSKSAQADVIGQV